MTRAGLYKALSPDGNPSLATVTRIARALGFRLAFRRVEIGETAPAAPHETTRRRA